MNLPEVNKFRSLLLLIPALLLSLSACTPDAAFDSTLAEEEAELIALESEVASTFDEVETFSIEAMEVMDFSPEARDYSDPAAITIPACATVTHDSLNKTITLDFGSGCVGADGKTRAGQLVLTYTRRLYIPGATLSIQSVGYNVDGVQVEGTKTMTNVSPNFQSNISLNVTLTGGKLIFANGDTATRAVNKTYTWVRAAHPAGDRYEVDGTVRGTNRSGDAYSCTIVSTLIRKRLCVRQGIRIPVKGLKLIKKTGRPNLLVDFGDGTCDTLVTLTANGNSWVKDLSN